MYPVSVTNSINQVCFMSGLIDGVFHWEHRVFPKVKFYSGCLRKAFAREEKGGVSYSNAFGSPLPIRHKACGRGQRVLTHLVIQK